MVSLNFQFHGEPFELLKMAIGWAKDFDLYISFEEFFPEYNAKRVEKDNVVIPGPDTNSVRRVALNLSPIDINVDSTLEFLDNNPNCVVLTIGHWNEIELRESSITANTDDDESLRLWKKIIRKAKAEMNKGASLFNPGNNTRVLAKSHRYTKGAKELAISGVKMLAAAGWVEYEFNNEVRS